MEKNSKTQFVLSKYSLFFFLTVKLERRHSQSKHKTFAAYPQENGENEQEIKDGGAEVFAVSLPWFALMAP